MSVKHMACCGNLLSPLDHTVQPGPADWTRGPAVRQATSPSRPPGLMIVVLGLYCNFLLVCRSVLLHWGISLPDAFYGVFGNGLTVALLVTGTYIYAESQALPRLCATKYLFKIYLWLFTIAALATYGMLLGNDWNRVAREGAVLVSMALFLYLGVDDRIWRVVEHHLTIIFFCGVLLILAYYSTPSSLSTPGWATGESGALNARFSRYTGSVAFLVRPLIGTGLLLGISGLVARDRTFWRAARISAPFWMFACEVGLFKFRSQAVLIGLAFTSVLVLRPVLEKRFRPGASVILLSIVALGAAYYLGTESWRTIEQRNTTEDNPLLDRRAEMDALLSDVGWMVLVGRGLGGAFDASSVRPADPNATQWTTVHVGVAVFALKGGLLLLALFLSFCTSGIPVRARSWYANPINLTAALLFPIYCLKYIINPIPLYPEYLMTVIPGMLLLARFGRREPHPIQKSKISLSHRPSAHICPQHHPEC